MRYMMMASLLFLLPFVTRAQTAPDWCLCLNKTKLLSSSFDSVASVQLPKESEGKLTICLLKKDTSQKRTVMLMNTEGQTLLHQVLPLTGTTASFSMDEVLHISGGGRFTIYLASVPADPAKAMLVRMAPVAICEVTWE